MRARFALVPLALFALSSVALSPRLAPDGPALLAGELPVPTTERLQVDGLLQPVEILKDLWGISHIYAETEHDLFFAQGYSAARDRLFQFEVWRRQATGTVSEILGPSEIERDRGARLFQFRGDLEAELNHYHPRGAQIIPAFVDGVNAYIAETRRDPSLLPIEFEMLGITPGDWTPGVVISRHQGLLGNITQELGLGIAVQAIGAEKVKELSYFHPGEPDIDLDPAIDGSLLRSEILDVYNAFRGRIQFRPEHVAPEYRRSGSVGGLGALSMPGVNEPFGPLERSAIGSNNWVVDGSRTLSGNPIMANDPHRVQAAPSLRYLVHLVGPGWDVIGGGEPVLPGVSIGHNEYGAWGLTVFSTDAEDLYVYETDPADPNRYRYDGGWEEMRTIEDRIPMKDGGEAEVVHKYTRHGPVVFEDPDNDLAYAVRAGWMEIGGAPYLASLRMDQARTWEEFREACNYSNIPGENMIWADVDGNIGWQAVGIAPIRRNWTGLVPVPGDGRYEWDGYLEIKHKPHVLNPDKGFWVTANENLVPPGYEHRDAVGWAWSDPFRSARIGEVLSTGRRFTLAEMMQLQTDYVSLPARSLVPMLRGLDWPPSALTVHRDELLDWDYDLRPESREAAIYVAWEREIMRGIVALAVPPEARQTLGFISMKKIIDWLAAPPVWFGALASEAPGAGPDANDPIAGRDEFLRQTFFAGLEDLVRRFGQDAAQWRYGDERFKHVLLRHPLSGAVNDETRELLEVGPAVRGGNGFTVGQTGFGDNQTSGASFRLITEAGDWDAAVFANTPGQGGDPMHPMYRNLFGGWARDGFFPLYYTRDKVEAVLAERIDLDPSR
ncbi:MAG: penicillin acylase family protein [Gemmatimonadota bacterium]|nr:penicillin acylase family protein [Gemmatimonadota bacterium]